MASLICLAGGRKRIWFITSFNLDSSSLQLGYAIKQLRSWLLLFLCRRIYAIAFHLLLFALCLWACEICPALCTRLLFSSRFLLVLILDVLGHAA